MFFIGEQENESHTFFVEKTPPSSYYNESE